jgi:hypothetical protein
MIIIKVTEEHLLKSDAYSIGRRGENEAEIIRVILPEDLQDKWLFLEFEKPDGTKFTTSKIDIINGVGEYSISGNLLDTAGMLKLEVVMRDEKGICWKSEPKKYSVIESINASDEVEKSNPDFITEAQKLLDEIKETGGGGGGIAEEKDPTVPAHVKSIKETDIKNWNSKASINDMTTYIEEHKDELKGADGKDGTNGKDGYTPVKGVDYFDGKDGANGKDGADGKTPVKGTDYYTEADKQEMVNSVIEALPKYNGGVS